MTMLSWIAVGFVSVGVSMITKSFAFSGERWKQLNMILDVNKSILLGYRFIINHSKLLWIKITVFDAIVRKVFSQQAQSTFKIFICFQVQVSWGESLW